MKLQTILIAVLLVCFSIPVFSQFDLSSFNYHEMPIEISSGKEKLNTSNPLLELRTVAIDVYEGGASADKFFLRFNAERKISTKLLDRYDSNQRKLAGKYLVTIYSDDWQKSELLLTKREVRQQEIYSDYSLRKINFYYLTLDVSDVPISLLQNCNRIEIEYCKVDR